MNYVRQRISAAARNRAYAAGRKEADRIKTYGNVRCRENAIRRDFDIINEELPLITKQGYGGGYSLMDGVGKYQNLLSQEQLKCLEKVAVTCNAKDRETIRSIIQEFGPYYGKLT